MPRATKERHGLRYSPEYGIWSNIVTRCYNPNYQQAEDYGGRGIKMCDAWRHSFIAFYADMGPRPGPEFSIERKDNNKGYSKENCIWATRMEQNSNRRNNIYIEFKGKHQYATQWARELGMKKDTLLMRLARGWSPERALTQPVRKRSV